MKTLYSLLIILLVSLCKEEQCGIKSEAKDAADCHNRTKGEGERCCYHNEKFYLNGDIHEEKTCNLMTKDQFEKFVSAYKSKKSYISSNGGSIDTLEWNCSANYIYISLLSLIILLF